VIFGNEGRKAKPKPSLINVMVVWWYMNKKNMNHEHHHDEFVGGVNEEVFASMSMSIISFYCTFNGPLLHVSV